MAINELNLDQHNSLIDFQMYAPTQSYKIQEITLCSQIIPVKDLQADV